MAKSIIVSYEGAHGLDKSVLIVGEKQPGKDVVIVNAFAGKEANELWTKLTVKKEKGDKSKPMKCKYFKPQMDELLSCCKRLYQLPGCGAGGCLHILLDDNNYRDSDLEFCRQYCSEHAEGEERELAMKILDMYSAMSLQERTLFDWYWNGRFPECLDRTGCEMCDLIEIPDYMEE